MTDDYTADLTAQQQKVLTFLNQPASYADIAEQFGFSESTARDHVRALGDAGVPLGDDKIDGRKVFYLQDEVNSYPVNPDFPDHDLRSKAAVTREAKETVHDIIRHLTQDLNGRAPPEPDDGLVTRESNEDMVVHRSDDHIGARYTDEYGDETFDAETGIQRVRTVSDRTFRLKQRQEQAGVEFDTLHLLLGGDHLHGTGIHPNQPWETDLPVPEQLTVASDIYMEFIDRATEEFETVQIVCQRGNHGELRGDGMGPDDNLDDAFFMSLDKRVRDRGYDNVRFVMSQGGYFTNFRMRADAEEDERKAQELGVAVEDLPAELQSGHRGHLRHGQNSLEHIGTSAGKKRWLQWHNQHQFSIAYRGHYHTFRIENIASKPVIESGAIVPPSDYEESLAEWSEPAATVHGCSDDRPVTWLYPISFE